LELCYDRKESGMRRLYSMFRRNLDDINAASCYFIAIVAGPPNLPFMEDALTEVCLGTAVTLKNDLGQSLTFALDPGDFADLPHREDFLAVTSETARALLGATVGQAISLPGRLRTEQRFVVSGITSVFRWLLHRAQEHV